MISQDDKQYLIDFLSSFIAHGGTPRATLTAPFIGDSNFPELLNGDNPRDLTIQAVNLCLKNGWKNDPPWLLTLLQIIPDGLDSKIEEIRQKIKRAKTSPEIEIINEKDSQGKILTLTKLIENEKGVARWSQIISFSSILLGLTLSGYIYFLSLPDSELPSRIEEILQIVFAIPAFIGIGITIITSNKYFAGKKFITSCEYLQIAYSTPPVPEEIDEQFMSLVDKYLTQI